jgi:hypothetical protein
MPDVFDRVDPVGVGENAGRLVDHQRIVLPAIPKPGDDIEIFPSAVVTIGVNGMRG